MWAVILMISLILIVVAVPLIKKNFIDKFRYINLDFQKTQLGKTVFYSTRIPVADKQGKIIAEYTMGFNKNDPRKLNYINVSIPNNLVEFNKQNVVYITLKSSMQNCEDTIPAMVNLAGFLKDFAGFNVSSATSDKDYANLNNLSYVTCENSPNNTVIYINSGNETKIEKTANNCYELIYNNCEISQVTEKFYWTILENYMKYFTRESNSFLDIFK